MKKVVFTKPPYMNASEQRIADMHTVINILNILVGELSLVEPREPELKDGFNAIDDELTSIARDIREGGDLVDLMLRIRKSETGVMGFMDQLGAVVTNSLRKAELKESVSNLESVYSILNKRLDEFDLRVENPDIWVKVDPVAFRQQFEDVFVAIAKNSKGRYGIHFNLARKGQGDYYIDLKVETNSADSLLWFPLRLIDVLRDLTANARKYTPPGGKVALAIYQNDDEVLAVIEDSGCGIPEDEMDKVVEFGYRASNVKSRPTLGGGFGLTKAAWLVTSWGGSLSIESEVDQGTMIKISVPNKDRPSNAVSWTI